MSEVQEVGFRFTEKAFRGKRDGNSGRTLVGFVCDTQNRKMLFPELAGEPLSDGQAHDLTVEYLERLWPSDSALTVIVSNISMKEQSNQMYLVRPPIEAAVTAGYGTAQGVPGFRCIVKDGYFLVTGVEKGFYSDAGLDELVLTAPVYVQVPPAPGEALAKTRPPNRFQRMCRTVSQTSNPSGDSSHRSWKIGPLTSSAQRILSTDGSCSVVMIRLKSTSPPAACDSTSPPRPSTGRDS